MPWCSILIVAALGCSFGDSKQAEPANEEQATPRPATTPQQPTKASDAAPPPRKPSYTLEPSEPPKDVVPAFTSLKRIKGETQVRPRRSVDTEIALSGGKAIGTVSYCVDRTGVPNRVELQRSTGHPDYDAQLQAAVFGWRFEPQLKDGEPIPTCTRATFVYKTKTPEIQQLSR